MSAQKPDYHIITKVFKGHALKAERDEVAHWIRADHGHRVEYRKLLQIWEAYGSHHENFKANTEGKLEEVVGMSPGRISLLRVAASIAFLLLTTFSLFQYHSKTADRTYTATVDGQEFRLPDQSLVTLKKGSTIVLDDEFGGTERKVRLEGYGYFSVSHDEQRPFQVYHGDVIVQVLGTEFLINDGPSGSAIHLFNGKVEVMTPASRLTLLPNESAIFNGQLTKHDGIEKGILSWAQPDLVFEDDELREIFQMLAWYYDVEIHTSAAIGTKRLTGHFTDQSAEEILTAIAQVHGLQLKKGSKTNYYTLLK